MKSQTKILAYSMRWKKTKLTKEQENALAHRKKLGWVITRSRITPSKWTRVDLLNMKNGAVRSLYWHNGWKVAH